MRSLSRLTVAVCVAWAGLAEAASQAGKGRDDEAALLGQATKRKYNEIERGFWFSLEGAPIGHVEWISRIPPSQPIRQLFPDDFGGGLRAGLRVGYDILGLVSVDGYMVSQFRDKRIRRGRPYTGDLTDLNAGLGLRLMPITLFKRLSFTGRLALGAAFLMPGDVARAYTNPGCISTTIPKPTEINPMCLALPGIPTPALPFGFVPFPAQVLAWTPTSELMLGVEYFTPLRHFSIGADLVLGVMPWPLGLHAGVVPNVKYSF